jgi:hypothetical protein
MKNTSPLDSFIEQILTETLRSKLSPKHREEKKAELTNQLFEHINRRAIEALPYESQLAFRKLLDQNPDQDALLNFMEHHVPNPSVLLTAALLEFRQQQLGK